MGNFTVLELSELAMQKRDEEIALQRGGAGERSSISANEVTAAHTVS